AVAGGALDLGRHVADRLDAAFVVLDAASGAGRALGRSDDAALGLVDLRAPTLEGDLRARDFTVNALAAPVGDLLRDGRAEIVDPTGGLGDLEQGLVRVCASTAIADDPGRALRGVRLAMRAGWRLTPETETAIAEGAPRLTGVSAERQRDELVGLLSEPTAAAGLRALDRRGGAPGPLRNRCRITSTSGSIRCVRSKALTRCWRTWTRSPPGVAHCGSISKSRWEAGSSVGRS